MKHIETSELIARAQTLVVSMESILKDIGPKLAEFGLMRQEAELLHSELRSRGALDDGQKPAT